MPLFVKHFVNGFILIDLLIDDGNLKNLKFSNVLRQDNFGYLEDTKYYLPRQVFQ